ncbi:MAG: sulfotransferase domain-containing protein [Proteobacteria bacterium]|nr:sulfotransferase domain-containing protein [Pseudomonadota bacterium]
MLPNFFVAGAQKCATTSLHMYLAGHPDIYLPQIKETKHFLVDERYIKGMNYYETHFFGGWQGEKAIGEVDPDYIYFDIALKRMERHLDLSERKFIFIFRNPVDRAFSHYLMTYRRGLEPLTFENAIELEKDRIKKDFYSKLHYSYIDRGYYFRQLQKFIQRTKPSQILILLTEDLKKDPPNTLKKCYDFLEIDNRFESNQPYVQHHKATLPKSMILLKNIINKEDTPMKKMGRFFVPNKKLRQKIRESLLKINQTEKKVISLQENTKKQLINVYIPENEKLATFIDRDLSHWNNG